MKPVRELWQKGNCAEATSSFCQMFLNARPIMFYENSPVDSESIVCQVRPFQPQQFPTAQAG